MTKYKNTTKEVFMIMIVSLAFATSAHASIATDRSGSVAVLNPVSVTIQSDVHATTSMNGRTEKGVYMEDGVNTTGGVKMKSGDENEGNTEMHATGTMRAKERANEHGMEGLEKAELHIDMDTDNEDEDMRGTSTIEVSEAAEVHSSKDFILFAKHKAKNDEHLKSVDIKDGKVDVEYAEEGKWFGILSATIPVHASADVAGHVEVKYPWYHIFVKKENSSAALQSRIALAIAAEKKGEKEGVVANTVKTDVSATLNIPELFDLIVTALKETSVSATAHAD